MADERVAFDWPPIAFVFTVASCVIVAIESAWTIYLASIGLYIEMSCSPQAIDCRDIGIPIVLWLGSQELLGVPLLIATAWLVSRAVRIVRHRRALLRASAF